MFKVNIKNTRMAPLLNLNKQMLALEETLMEKIKDKFGKAILLPLGFLILCIVLVYWSDDVHRLVKQYQKLCI